MTALFSCLQAEPGRPLDWRGENWDFLEGGQTSGRRQGDEMSAREEATLTLQTRAGGTVIMGAIITRAELGLFGELTLPSPEWKAVGWRSGKDMLRRLEEGERNN